MTTAGTGVGASVEMDGGGRETLGGSWASGSPEESAGIGDLAGDAIAEFLVIGSNQMRLRSAGRSYNPWGWEGTERGEGDGLGTGSAAGGGTGAVTDGATVPEGTPEDRGPAGA